MSFLQISEPGESTAKQACKRRAIGIDLGTTNTLVAAVIDGDPRVLRGDDGAALLPSVVHYGNGAVIVGQRAEELAVEHPQDTIASVKRFVGRGSDDGEAMLRRPSYRFAHGDERVVRFRVDGDRVVTPVEVSAEIVRVARARAEASLGGEVEAAVITVPAYFDDAQRQATRDAGRLAGLDVMRLLAEPTAAALAYGLDRGSRGTFAVYDLGGGTFDISILTLVDGVFKVIATGGDSALGGDDFDRALAEVILAEIGASESHDNSLLRQVVREARAVKEHLSDRDVCDYKISRPDGSEAEGRFTRAQLVELMGPLLAKTRAACKRALRDAGVRREDLDGVILVGGSTRSPVVRDYVADVFGREPSCELDPEHVVALGAAVQAEMLVGGGSEVLLLDVLPLSLGIETMGGVVEKIILRNSTIPCGAEQVFTTYADNQTGFDIHVVQGERETVEESRSLARFQLKGIPPMVAGMARIEIRFVVDADGLLRVAAREQLTGLEAAIEVKPSYGLTDEEIERMLLDSFEHAESDLSARNLRVERVEAERIVSATRAAMSSDDGLLDDQTRAETERAIEALLSAMKGTDHLAIRSAIEALDIASKPFAERRMNRAIHAGLSGQRLHDVEQKLQ